MSLAGFASDLDWEKYMKDDQIRDIVARIRDRVDNMEDDDDMADAPRVKLVVVGDGAVGKTCLLVAYESGQFPEDYVPTVFENRTATMTYKGEKVLLYLWDTAGQEDYDRLRPLSYPGTDVVLLVFSLMNDISYEAVEEKWSKEVGVYIPDVPMILVGNKVDLRDSNVEDPHANGEGRPVTHEEGQDLADELGCVAYCEVSAKTGKGLNNVFETAVRVVLESRAQQAAPQSKSSSKDKKKKRR